MKKAKLVPQVVNVYCPHCKKILRDPFVDSYMWEVHTLDAYVKGLCDRCGEEYEFPKWIKYEVRRD